MAKRLYKVEKGKQICGVCAGIAEYLNVDPTIIRIAWCIFTLVALGTGILIYLICAFVFPEKTEADNLITQNNNNNPQ